MLLPPLSLYIHIPWCVRKCPYCDFNSHQNSSNLPVWEYIEALEADLLNDLEYVQGRKLHSIFIGGGTPSLFPADAIEVLLIHLENLLGFNDQIEITLEANPGASEYNNLKLLRHAGVNRLSFGVQSFNTNHLKLLGRIHNDKEIYSAYENARKAGFNNINLDLMHGLPEQSVEQAMDDLDKAATLLPEHISWYQLTLEPNTAFYSSPPELPGESVLNEIVSQGEKKLAEHGFNQYEVSAYAKQKKQSQHNLNYWQFGDYLAIGAGAHGKITTLDGSIFRFRKTRLPKDYLEKNKPFKTGVTEVKKEELPLEFMMNALRLTDGIELSLFEERTGIHIQTLDSKLRNLETQGLISIENQQIRTTTLGRNFLNSLLEAF